MQIEEVPFAKTALGRRWISIVRSVATAIDAGRDTYRLHQAAPQMQPTSLEAHARGIVNSVVNSSLQARSSPLQVPDNGKGAWHRFNMLHPAGNARPFDPEARYGATKGTGMVPEAFSPISLSEVTLPLISAAGRRSFVQGYCDWKADLDNRFLQLDSHLGACAQIRQSATFKHAFDIAPSGTSPLHILVANAVRAAWNQIDGFQSTMGELGSQSCHGFALGDCVWRRGLTKLSVSVGGGKEPLQIPSEVIGSIELFPHRDLVFDLNDDEPWIVLGPGRWDRINSPENRQLQKYMMVKSTGAGNAIRHRGYGWSVEPLVYLGNLPLERLAAVIETFGLPTPYLQRKAGQPLSAELHSRMMDVLNALGLGQPTVIEDAYGTLGHSPVPSNLAPLHGQMMAIVKTEISKRVLSSTLQMELGASGGAYAATESHRDQQTEVQNTDCSLYAEALRTQPFRWLCQANSEVWARHFNRYVPGGCSPDDVVAAAPLCSWLINDTTPAQRLQIFQGVAAMKNPDGSPMQIDPAQVRSELGVRAPMPDFTYDAEAPVVAPAAPAAPATAAPAALAPASAPEAPDAV